MKMCPISGCNAEISREHLMCARHWNKVPLRMQREVYRTLKAWEEGGGIREYLLATLRAQLFVAQAEKKTKVIAVLEKEIANVEARIAKKSEVCA
jgi:hypothetical protein